MDAIDHAEIALLVNVFTGNENRQDEAAQADAAELIELLMNKAIDPDDIFAKATIRYLFHREMWQTDWSPVLMKFFGHQEFRSKLEPEDYRAQTDALIQRWFNYQMPGKAGAAPRSKAKPKAKPKAKSDEKTA